MSVAEDSLDKDDEDVEPIPVPSDPTVKDLIDAVDNLANQAQYNLFYSELCDNLGDTASRELWAIRDKTAAATARVLAGINIEDLVNDLPIKIIPRQDFEQLLALERAKVVEQFKPAKPIEEVDRDQALDRLKKMFSDVEGVDLPSNDLWESVQKQATSAVPRINAARERGVPESYIRRCALAHVKNFVVGKDRNRNAQLENFRVIVRFLKSMKFGTDDDVAFFEHLASGDK